MIDGKKQCIFKIPSQLPFQEYRQEQMIYLHVGGM